jgi:protein involved in polysaccharide export with SLBB domain
VALIGAVVKPGVYYLTGFDQTIQDVLTEAGGLTPKAGTKIFLSPGGNGASRGAGEAIARVGVVGTQEMAAGFKRRIGIDLTRLYQGQSAPELNIPLRGGDTLLIPLAGEVYVDGWVNTPGAYPATRGLTAADAISNAGGFHFAAARGSLSLVRGTSRAEISNDKTEKVYLETGDRLDVGSNPLKVTLWGMYRFVTSVFRIGVGGQAVPNRTPGSE